MHSLFLSLARLRLRLLAILIVCLTPAALTAETVVFRNECRAPLVVETTWVVRGVLKREQYPLKYTEKTPALETDCDKVITVYCGKSGRRLFRDALRISLIPKAFGIVPDQRRPGFVRMEPRRVKSEP